MGDYDNIYEPEVKESKSLIFLTSIWIVPIVALIITGWLLYQHFSKEGPEIKILFKNSGGLQAGVSVVKFRDVPVGKVVNIKIQEEGDGVEVYVRMNKETEPYLNDTTKFWIVKPEVSTSGIRGIETILSGTYIAMYAKRKKDSSKRVFRGLEKPYRAVGEGEYFLLKSSSFNSNIHVGTPITYKNIEVGRVEHMALAPDGKDVNLVIFVKKPYDRLINSTTKFWVQGMLDFDFRRGVLDIRVAPLITLFAGGITFESKLDKKYPKPKPNRFFTLYKSFLDAQEKKLGADIPVYKKFIFEFEGEVSGLNIRSPITYLGFRIGEVEDYEIKYDDIKKTMKAQVIGKIDVSVFRTKDRDGLSNLEDAISQGLRATLRQINPLIDALKIELIYPKNIKRKKFVLLESRDNALVFPTIKTREGGLLDKLYKLSDSFSDLNVSSIVNNINSSIENLNKILEDKSLKSLPKETKALLKELRESIKNLQVKKISKKLNRSLIEFRRALRKTNNILKKFGKNSTIYDKLNDTLLELHKSANEANRLIRKLNRKPNSIIFGD